MNNHDNHNTLASLVKQNTNSTVIIEAQQPIWIRLDIDQWKNFKICHGNSLNDIHVHFEDLMNRDEEVEIKPLVQSALGFRPNGISSVWVIDWTQTQKTRSHEVF